MERFSLGEEVESLKIEAGGCQFQTEESDDHSFYVETENADRFQAYLEDGVLCIRITTASKSWNDWGKLGTCKVTLYVPEDYHYRDVDIELGAGVLEFEELDADRVSMKVGAGQIVAEDLRADSLEAEIGMGQLELENVYVQGLKADIGMGDLTVEGILDGDVDVSCSMGNVDIEIEGSQKDFNYTIEGSMGNIDLGSASYSGFGVSKRIDNGARKNMEIECEAGNITISFTD